MPPAPRDHSPETAAHLSADLTRMGLEGAHFTEVLDRFCTSLSAAGVPLLRAHVTLRAHHPEFGSFAHRWRRADGLETQAFEHRAAPPDEWVQSPLYFLLGQEIPELRQRLDDPDPVYNFPFFDELRAQGATDYIAFKTFFFEAPAALAVDPNAPPQGCLLSLASDGESGFSDGDLDLARAAMPAMLLGLKAQSNRQMAEDITATYLGQDAGHRVLSGAITRGSLQRLNAVIAYFDLSGFTKLSEALAGAEIVEMLNDYFDIAVEVVHGHGGNVLKFMGDGMLAIFDVEKVAAANAAALDAAVALRQGVAEVSARRRAAGQAHTGFTLALHRGEVLYGNIGGRNRLDFTVIGPAVNTAARLSGMCAHVDQAIVISAQVAQPLLDTRADLVALGQYRLRGVAERQALFTLD